MEVYFVATGMCTVFYVIYKLIVIHGKMATLIYFFGVEMLLILGGIKFAINDIGNIASWIVFQVAFILFVISYFNDNRRKLYECFANSNISIMYSWGFRDLSKEELDKYICCMERYLKCEKEKDYKCIALIGNENNIIEIHYFFKKLKYFYKYLEIHRIEESEFEELEFIKNGVYAHCVLR